ncbi:MAG: phosphate/phosphite/phosphonate ABC transporter substrate-binding protein [Candidatus Electrothrix sp. YB6]
MNKILFFLILLCSLFFLFCGGVCVSAAAEEYTLSMQPLFSQEKTTAVLTSLAKALTKETGNTISPLPVQNTDQYTADILHGNIVVGYENPSVYVRLSGVHEVIAAAVQGEDDKGLRGIIISRPEAGITKLTDLKDKNIMIVSRNSAGGFLSQKLSLREEGIDVEWDCQLSEAAEGREENIIISVSIGDVDAGFISKAALHAADRYIVPGSVTTVAETAPLPNWTFSVSRNMPQEQKDDLREALLRLPEDTPAFRVLGITGFKAASDTDYDIIRSITD